MRFEVSIDFSSILVPTCLPKSCRNRPKIDLGTLLGHPRRPRVAQERLRGAPRVSGSVQGAPRESPRSLPGAAGDTPGRQKGRPGACRGDRNRRRVASRSEKIASLPRTSFGKRRRRDFRSIFGSIFEVFRCRVQPTARSPRNPRDRVIRP